MNEKNRELKSKVYMGETLRTQDALRRVREETLLRSSRASVSLNCEIRGNTLKIYLYLLRHGPSELREIQRGTGLSSPSLVSYHIGKLSEAGYARQDEFGKYLVIRETADQVLEGYSKMGPAIVPQMLFFALFFTIIGAFFAIMTVFTTTFINYLVVVCGAMIFVFWYETIRLWRRLAS